MCCASRRTGSRPSTKSTSATSRKTPQPASSSACLSGPGPSTSRSIAWRSRRTDLGRQQLAGAERIGVSVIYRTTYMDVRTLARSNFRSRCGRRPRNAGRVIEHGARRAQPAVDRELALQDEPDLGEAVIVIGMMGARREPQDAGIGRGRLLGAGMEQHLAGLARPADGLPVDLVEMAHLAGQMIR